ncbi:crotonobetainyl-CoA:carnitine CoA-transferase CaiB-like acyl-CoA transferase [Pacificibacter maritimus]|uniref:Crotonobetainyl-CoA:carnitine CoA-transferase CaiB-like acyl-CoA transferase n=1 Tax=Pacificibacter maritimus TaxID=762213 RepID=A0A3N4VDA4_9RHOB|nr:CaiB/BaiF CoA-transferase family protein [Pacificibacter maritimus]RPE70924.1 crotonobetainyl-CoA:carnitine CoA-transferase CaiB-like acyl-CoA transferase [Pacificibacter maritimus]
MRPLDGIRIIDFSRVLAGPMATQILAEFGAEVTKIERPGIGDESRSFEPMFDGGQSAYYSAFNRSKRSIAVDLKTDAGRQLAFDLAAQADVLVENFLPGGMEKHGLSYEALSAVNPRLIYISNTGFGQTGPYKDRKGYDTIFQALSGVIDLTGHPDGPPAKVGLPFADLTSGLWIAIAALTGLVGRAGSGKGCHVDLAMMDVQVAMLTLPAARHFALGETPKRVGTEHLGRVPSAAYQCDGGAWLFISASDQHWPLLCDVLGLTELAKDSSLAHNRQRVERRDEVTAALSAAIAQRDRFELAESLRAAGVPAGEVNTVPDILKDPHITARGMVDHFDDPERGPTLGLRTPARFSGYDPHRFEAPPKLGADTHKILSDELGLTEDQITALYDKGIVA